MLWKKFNQNIAVEVTSSQLMNALQSVQRALASLNDQEVELSLSISIKGKPIQEQPEQTWKALAEAHLRERVKNPHDYRALSIELEGMKNAGYDWRRDFSSYGELSRFLSSLYSCDVNKLILRNRIDDLDEERNKYVIEDAFSYWYNVIPNFYTK